MKKLLTLLLAAAMLLSLCACGSPSKPKELEDISDEDWEAAAEALEDMYEEEPVVETEAAAKIYELGEVIVSADGMVELTIDDFYFGSEFEYGTLMCPASGRNSVRKPPEEHVYLFYTGTITFIGESKEGHYYSFKQDIEVDYNDGYKFNQNGTMNGDYGFREVGDTTANVDWTARFEPLTGTKTRELIGVVGVADVIETDTASPLLLNMTMNEYSDGVSKQVKFTVRLR